MEAWAASLQDGKGEAPEEFGAVVKKKMTPQALLPFEWDRQKPKAEFVSKEEDKKRLERRMKIRYAKRANDGSIRGPAIKI